MEATDSKEYSEGAEERDEASWIMCADDGDLAPRQASTLQLRANVSCNIAPKSSNC